ncbi:hypothetical protein V6N13_004126 [Hibiscus sabdariffa]|uniref:Uncharacterized protein n=1 Tax=Hibiscus sabdariffa TaxID=183260 RepID=A0ABR2RXM6_9ROSI
MAEDDDVNLLDADNVETVMTDVTEGNGLGVEDDVWSAVVARLGLENEQAVWSYVGPETKQPVPNYPSYEPPAHMYDVDYIAMRDREHEARLFGSSSSSNYTRLMEEVCRMVEEPKRQLGSTKEETTRWRAEVEVEGCL